MATLDLLPATTYTPPPPGQAPRRNMALNTIMEADEESRAPSPLPLPKFQHQYVSADWLSPLSDHFPTPRGHHFMSAPIVPASPSSASESEPSTRDSLTWSRNSVTTQGTNFDDLYDVSDDEENRKIARAQSKLRRSNASSQRLSGGSLQGQRLPSLIIPQEQQQISLAQQMSKMLLSPVPPTPPPKVPMSPAIFRYLSTQDIPSAAPSLDGSVTSDQLSAMSAPPTPNIGADETDEGDNWGGIHLAPDAMATLQALSDADASDETAEQVIEIPQMTPELEMQQSPGMVSTVRRHNSVVLSPEDQRLMRGLTAIELPSPGEFFSSLSFNSRNTWHMESIDAMSPAPPSSTTAEHFYKTPWSSQPIERIIEMSETQSEGCPTARPTLIQQDSDETIRDTFSPSSADEDFSVQEIGYDETYSQKLQESANENFDRTNMWLSAQTNYLSVLLNPPEDRDDEAAIKLRDDATAEKALVVVEEAPKKAVRFSEFITTSTATVALGCALPKKGRHESSYRHAFENSIMRSRVRDTFVHSLPRFEALQSQRITFPLAHRNQLLGKYQLSVVPMSEKKKRESANVARGDETPEDNAQRLKQEKEHEAFEQMRGASWNVTAGKLLNGGKLIAAPVAKKLARLSSMGPTTTGKPRDRARILDLGGQGTCDWAWHCAFEYPSTKVYTITTKSLRQLSNSNIRGPLNHRQVAVQKLTKLPFPDAHFDLVSARNLYTILHVDGVNGEDEYEKCFQEIMRVLKPGGYVEFNVMDSDLVNAGCLGQAKSVEFGYCLKTRGYDPSPSKTFVSKLQKAGFVNTKRAWMFLPMGAPLSKKESMSDTSGLAGEGKVVKMEAMVTGNTDAVANITGVFGGWAWERWMLKLQMERGVEEGHLLEGVYDIVEEGRRCGAGWRMLTGYARKPLR